MIWYTRITGKTVEILRFLFTGLSALFSSHSINFDFSRKKESATIDNVNKMLIKESVPI